MYKYRVGENATEQARVEGLVGGTAIDTVDATTLKIGGTAVTATAAEINAKCDDSSRYVVVTDATTYSITAANSGKVHIVPDLTADITISLPTEADGLSYEFWYGGAAADAQDWIFDTGSNTNYFIGGVTHIDTDAGAGGDEVVPVFSDGDSNSKLTVNVPQCGTRVSFFCNGTQWYINGIVVAATAPAFADQA